MSEIMGTSAGIKIMRDQDVDDYLVINNMPSPRAEGIHEFLTQYFGSSIGVLVSVEAEAVTFDIRLMAGADEFYERGHSTADLVAEAVRYIFGHIGVVPYCFNLEVWCG